MVKKTDKKAFTLIEVLVVIAIVGILALLAVPRFIGHTQKAELVRIQHDVKAMEKEIGAKLINGDNEFNKWGSNSKDLNQLTQENKLFENEGIAKKVDPVDGTYKVIPEEYKAKINTKLKGTFYANSGGKVYYEHTKPLVGIPNETDWTDIPIETFESKRNKEVGGIGYINKNNFIKYEESGSIAIEESPHLGSGMGSTPGKGKGSYKVSMSIPKQKGLLTGVFLYGYDETTDRSYEIDIETMFYKGEWQIWTTIHNSTHPNYEYGKYLTGKSWATQIDEPETGVIFQERVSMADLGGFLDPNGNVIPGKKHIFQIDYMTDHVAFHINGKQIARWNDTFHNPEDIVMDFTLSTFWTHWLGRPETWDYEEIDFDNVQFKSE